MFSIVSLRLLLIKRGLLLGKRSKLLSKRAIRGRTAKSEHCPGWARAHSLHRGSEGSLGNYSNPPRAADRSWKLAWALAEGASCRGARSNSRRCSIPATRFATPPAREHPPPIPLFDRKRPSLRPDLPPGKAPRAAA